MSASRSSKPLKLQGPLREELEHWLFLEVPSLPFEIPEKFNRLRFIQILPVLLGEVFSLAFFLVVSPIIGINLFCPLILLLRRLWQAQMFCLHFCLPACLKQVFFGSSHLILISACFTFLVQITQRIVPLVISPAKML